MKRKINCERARAFPIEKALEKLGHFPKKTAEKEAWFLSPFRSETQASFKVSKTKNRWYDHGEGSGGNVIDLVCRILKCSIVETLEFLNDDLVDNASKHLLGFEPIRTEIQIIQVQDIEHPALIQYLKSRGISKTIANNFCNEVWYSFKARQFFAIGLRNSKNGWELRNKLYKNSSSPKWFTYIKKDKKRLVILEGMFDLLSLSVLNLSLVNSSDIIVLNSTSFIKKVENHIPKYEVVQLYLDNDKAGKEATNYLMKNHYHIVDQSKTYKNHDDLNTFLCHENKR